MGNLIKQQTEDDFITELIAISNETIDIEKIERIKMNSNFTPKELVVLYRRFEELDEKGRGVISNAEFLCLREFMYNPLKTRLKQAIPFRSDDYIMAFADSDFKSIEEKINSPSNDSKSNSKYGRNPWKGINYVSPEKKITEITSDNPLDLISYIDYELFCIYLSVFCPRTPMDRKTNCISYIVLFKIFDSDDDGKLTRSDLNDTLRQLLGPGISDLDLEAIILKVFEEVDTAEKNFIDKDGNKLLRFC